MSFAVYTTKEIRCGSRLLFRVAGSKLLD